MFRSFLKISGAFAALWFSSSGIGQAAQSDGSATGAATRAHIKCQYDQAKRLDDGKSDARSIGEAVATACSATFSSLIDVMSEGESRRYRRMLSEEIARGAIAEATGIVLTIRNSKKSVEYKETKALTEASPFFEGGQSDGAALLAMCLERASDCTNFAEAAINSFSAGVTFSQAALPFCLPEPYRRFELLGDLREIASHGDDLLAMPASEAVIVLMMRRFPCEGIG